ncbi:hypothetical protein PYK79_20990 [Streptomyces sp. ID05-04B]|uniref:hypothetical protein n=1 Tax=unclassified Streptomyces TaxID=2593676 RepID=UPI000D1B71B9|nr:MULTISPECIES: hypothetical protein [unclassified Streptomyces]AVV43453.1 hypothetical protein C6376_20440 [Streptomyces sp. P3]MDX5565291.1 hypothetical protein [Streptomyces sp. ID05-04B]
MSRRVSLPGADELFRTTGGTALQPSAPRRNANGEARVPAPAGESDGVAAGGAQDAPQAVPAQGGDGEGAEHVAADAGPADAGESRTRGTPGERAERRQGVQEGSASADDQPRKRGRQASRRPSGRERHDEKITVYVSAEELMDLEHARLVLRGEHGLAVDRGRIVREAVAVVLADLESRGDASILVRRLRGR